MATGVSFFSRPFIGQSLEIHVYILPHEYTHTYFCIYPSVLCEGKHEFTLMSSTLTQDLVMTCTIFSFYKGENLQLGR